MACGKSAGRSIDYYRLVNSAAYLQKTGAYEASAAKWREVLELNPDDEVAHRKPGNRAADDGPPRGIRGAFAESAEIKLRAALEADPAVGAGIQRSRRAAGRRPGALEEAVAQFEKAAALKPDFAAARANLGGALAEARQAGRGAGPNCARRSKSDARYAPAHYNLGLVLSRRGDAQGADSANGERHWSSTRSTRRPTISLGDALYAQGRTAEALAHWRAAIELRPNDAQALLRAAWVLATSPDAGHPQRRRRAGVRGAGRRNLGGKDAQALDTLAAAYAEKGQFADAALTARRAQARATEENQPALAAEIKARIAWYEAGRPFRERDASAARP